LTAPLDFTALQRQTFPPAVRIAHRARTARAPGIKMTAHWILRTGPTGRIAPPAYRRAIRTARCAGDFHRGNNAFIGIPARRSIAPMEPIRGVLQPRPRPFHR